MNDITEFIVRAEKFGLNSNNYKNILLLTKTSWKPL